MTEAEASQPPTPSPQPPLDLWLNVYRQMVTIREFEEQVNELYTTAIMPGLAHLSIGQEGTEIGRAHV